MEVEKRWLKPPFFMEKKCCIFKEIYFFILCFFIPMLAVSTEAVRLFCPWNPLTITPSAEGTCLLEYLSNLYEPVTQFSLSQKQEAENQWSALTDDTDRIYLLLAEQDVYSLWCLTDRLDRQLVESPINRVARNDSASADMQLVNWVLQRFWWVIIDMAGAERARVFGREVLASPTIPIDRETDLQSRLSLKVEPVDARTFQRGQEICLEFQALATQHLGRDAVTLIFAELERKVSLVPIPAPTSFENTL
jgi:hypothetical protein